MMPSLVTTTDEEGFPPKPTVGDGGPGEAEPADEQDVDSTA